MRSRGGSYSGISCKRTNRAHRVERFTQKRFDLCGVREPIEDSRSAGVVREYDRAAKARRGADTGGGGFAPIGAWCNVLERIRVDGCWVEGPVAYDPHNTIEL